MTPFFEDRWLTIYGGDCRAVLRELEPASVHCVVTSPPYWGLRDYGLPPSVWGGDPDHEHAWFDYGIAPKLGGTGASTLGAASGGHAISAAGIARSQARQERAGGKAAWCECGAWLGCLGLEPDPFQFVEHLVEVFREIRRVLRPDGTAWLNLGDSFASKSRGTDGGWDKSRLHNPGRIQKAQSASMRSSGERHRGKSAGLKSKDLVGVPWRVAFALQDDGWWLRRDIVWSKPNPMPESTRDRPTSAHEYVFLLAKSEHYYYDADAIAEPASSTPDSWKMADGWATHEGGHGSIHRDGREKGRSARDMRDPLGRERRPSGWAPSDNGSLIGRYKTATTPHAGGRRQSPEPGEPGAFTLIDGQIMRSKRSVWTIATAPYPDAHFATFPPKLVEPCVKAGTSERGVCPECGAPWQRVTAARLRPLTDASNGIAPENAARGVRTPDPTGRGGNTLAHGERLTSGWRPTCRCVVSGDGVDDPGVAPHEPVPAVVMDPFAGTGTVGMVAQSLSRRAVLIELNPDYIRQIKARAARGWDVGGPILEDDGTTVDPEDSIWRMLAEVP